MGNGPTMGNLLVMVTATWIEGEPNNETIWYKPDTNILSV